jgi:hypothetical protein
LIRLKVQIGHLAADVVERRVGMQRLRNGGRNGPQQLPVAQIAYGRAVVRHHKFVASTVGAENAYERIAFVDSQ